MSKNDAMKHIAIILVLLVAVTAGCAETPAAAPGLVVPPAVSADDKGSVVQANNAFAFNLYANLRGREGNLFFSPESLSAALSMAWCGARGETAGQMATVLGYRTDRPITPEWIAKAYGEHLTELFAKPKGYELLAANALWGQKGYPFAPDYLALLKAHYGAGLEEADFAGDREGARKTINTWVKDRTRGKVEDLLAPGVLRPETQLVLANAVYFKARWMEPFAHVLTKPGDFYPPTSRRVSVPMMHEKGHYKYADDDQVQVLEMPYLDDEVSMVVILPRKRDGLPELERSITPAKVEAWIAQFRYRGVEVTLPKFASTSAVSLGETLAAMGMPRAFSVTDADFSGISAAKEGLFLQAVIHKAYVNVDEDGTEAAAATVAATAPAAPAPSREEPPVFCADHPFLFLIRDTKSGCILFLGRVVNPKE